MNNLNTIMCVYVIVIIIYNFLYSLFAFSVCSYYKWLYMYHTGSSNATLDKVWSSSSRR